MSEVKSTIIVPISAPGDGEGSMIVELADDFDTVFNKCFPIQNASSNLEHRANMTHTLVDGRRISIQPQAIAIIVEGEWSQE